MQSTTRLTKWFGVLSHEPSYIPPRNPTEPFDDLEVTETVFLVEADQRARRSMSWILGEAGLDVVPYLSGEDFLSGLTSDVPGCLLVNLHLPGMSGVSVIEELGRRGMTMPTILISGRRDTQVAIEAFRSGAFDVIGDDFDFALLERVERALGADTRRRQRDLARTELRARLNALTPRERQVVELVAHGQANKVIAYDLRISERTVEVHRAKAMRKIGAGSAADLVRIVLLAGTPGDVMRH